MRKVSSRCVPRIQWTQGYWYPISVWNWCRFPILRPNGNPSNGFTPTHHHRRHFAKETSAILQDSKGIILMHWFQRALRSAAPYQDLLEKKFMTTLQQKRTGRIKTTLLYIEHPVFKNFLQKQLWRDFSYSLLHLLIFGCFQCSRLPSGSRILQSRYSNISNCQLCLTDL